MMHISAMSPRDHQPAAASTAPTVLRLHNPHDILGTIPFLLRFHPEESFVFLVLKNRRLLLTARVDIGPDPDGPALGTYFRRVCADHGGDALIVVAYATDVARAGAVVDTIIDAATPVRVPEALVADGQRWYSRLCQKACCPPAGTLYAPDTSAAAARAVVAGLPALPNRAALQESVAGPRGAAVPAAENAFEEALGELADIGPEAGRDRLALMIEEFCLHRRSLTLRECAELAVLASDPEVREVAIERLRKRDADAHVALWHQVVSAALAPFETAPLCLLGLAAWVDGNGALQVVCMERAETINPDFSMLPMLEAINARCLPPSAWEEMRAA